MKKIMDKSKIIYGSTLVEVLVSMILVGILMLSATTFFVAAWRLDTELQEYVTVLNNIASTLEFGIIKKGAALSSAEKRTDRFRGINFDYNYLGNYVNTVNSNCLYLTCKPNTGDNGMKFFVLKTAYYKKWDK